MKTVFLLNLLFVLHFSSFSQNDSILILDSFTLMPIDSVQLYDLNKNLICESNSSGFLVFDISIKKCYLKKDGFFDYEMREKKDTIFLISISQEIEEVTISPIDLSRLYEKIIKNSVESLHKEPFLYGQLIDSTFFISKNYEDTLYYCMIIDLKIQLLNKKNRVKKRIFIGESIIYYSDSSLKSSFYNYYSKNLSIENVVDLILIQKKRTSKTSLQSKQFKKYCLNKTLDSLSFVSSKDLGRIDVSYNKNDFLFKVFQFQYENKYKLLYQFDFENNQREYKKFNLYFSKKSNIEEENVISKKEFNFTKQSNLTYTRVKKQKSFFFLRKNAKFIKI